MFLLNSTPNEEFLDSLPNLQYKMFLLNSQAELILQQAQWNLQYKMFLLNSNFLPKTFLQKVIYNTKCSY